MKTQISNNFVVAVLLFLSLAITAAQAQDAKPKKNVYTTSGGEIIFSWANTTIGGQVAPAVIRFSPVFNFQNQVHMDASDHFGFFTGLSIRNVGFIYDDPVAVNTRYKMRSYTLGIPFAVKAGDMSGYFLFGGYELELPFNFKEKTFVNEQRVSRSSAWFSNRTPSVYHSLFAGIQTPFGTQLKFKYYMTNFVNKSFAANDGSGGTVYPYANMDANVFYVSISVQILKGTHLSMK